MSMSVKEAVPWLKRYQGYAPTPEPDEDGKPVCYVHGFGLADECVDTLLAAVDLEQDPSNHNRQLDASA